VVSIRPAHTDADLEAWRAVRMAALPYERCPTVTELRGLERPGRHLLLAEVDGVVVGHGLTDRSDLAGRQSLTPRVVPEHRRSGYGTALLQALAELAAQAGPEIVGADCDDPGSVAFAEVFGFAEVNRQVEQVRAIGDEPRPAVPADFTVVTVAERPELWEAAYHQIGVDGLADMAVNAPMQTTLEQWQRDWIVTPEATFLAVAGDEIIGTASVMLDEDVPDRAEQGFTTVRRDWRGRHVASTLKRLTLWWAAQHGLREIYTWTQAGNDDMRRINEHLGFTYRLVSVRMEARLPLTRKPSAD
jgi:GNAT superfamily N-acetyltransferase